MFPNILGMKSKKGNAGAVMAAGGTIFALFFIAVLVFALTLTGAEMKNVTNDSVAQEVIDDTLSGVQTFSGFSPVLWIVTGVGALISILVGAFGFMWATGAGPFRR